ncbi:hypothetical protein HBI56_213740 [Parastagonospora nodorum]|nr:hypothetical protein HBH49_235820 [Parastagonospora nodorum]KAH4898092.1 hypothetical protein HBI80_189290 [Parastagonospora nodorum]KAH5170589.1 hypothetical protein HBH68_219120 [Parastagonospora nodorum]KAH5289637.1 hypothetical protein HBI11_225100 [Parastagonospora nodorum]KAH5443274.1 hypothetical protein HBI30_228640 [Parastagonospora nodorum]
MCEAISTTLSKLQYRQEPLAIIGFGCRLPGGNSNPQKLWEFLERGEVAYNKAPKDRFNIDGHYDGSHKPRTMRQGGGMFLNDVDLADFDAPFFEISGTEAVAMDPNQRQMLEVVYEGLENAGIPLETLGGKAVGCFVGSYSSDYGDMQNRDPEDRPANNALGVGRAILANRLSHFLNIRGPSVTLDTACSGSLQGLDIAARYLNSGEVEAAIVATANLYMSPEHMIDAGNVGSAHSPTALCHTFDVSADGYVKAEAVSCVIVKRLSDAFRDRDPVRAVVLGTASTSNGRTAGIASPNAEAQALAIRAAYANAGITDLNNTAYLECHGTGTQAGDPTEVRGAGSFFAPSRPADKPLLIGSIKSNIGHSEPSAGISGLLKATLAIEHGVIPGTPTFINPSPKIDFAGNRVRAFRSAIPWPKDTLRRASVNSFGYGGSNAHAILELPDQNVVRHVKSWVSGEDQELSFEDDSERPYLLVLSANDAASLKGNIKTLSNHLINPRVKLALPDLAYTLSERRSKLWHRGFITTHKADDLDENSFFLAKKHAQAPRVGFVFTGQGAQWSQMGAQLLQFFPWTRSILEELDDVLQSQPSPPAWSLLAELTEPRSAEHLRQPEYSQPLVTALQLVILAVLESWGIRPSSVVGHSSGEIAASYAAGLLDRAGAIKAAFYRGRAAVNSKETAEKDVGMLAVGLGAEAASVFLEKHLGEAWIACFNSPSSITVSGRNSTLELLKSEISAAGHFARLLQVDLAYHSELMGPIGVEYEKLLASDSNFSPLEVDTSSSVTMYSSVTTEKKTTQADALYWKTNMVSAVRFDEALQAMLTSADSPNVLIEIGPSGALAGPVSQVLKSLPAVGGEVTYTAAWSRGTNSGKTIFDVAGRLFAAGAPIDLSVVNQYNVDPQNLPRTIIDLPNYSWNHSVKYWHENAASKDWRFRKYVVHDLLGSKLLGTSWNNPTWKNHLDVANVPWLLDHKMGGDAIMPGAGFVTMALEAMWQKHCALLPDAAGIAPNDLSYRFRNVKFNRALVVTLNQVPGGKDWHEFRISSTLGDAVQEHVVGLARIQEPFSDIIDGADAEPLKSPQASKLWYKAEREIAMDFGPAFQRLLQIEAVSGQRSCRTLMSLAPPESKWKPQSYYPLHPAALDGCLQTPIPANAEGERGNVKDVMIPAIIDDIVINRVPADLTTGRSVARSNYSGRGRKELDKSWIAQTSVYDSETGQLLVKVSGLNYVKLDVAPKADPHTFLRIDWKPDVDSLTQDQVFHLPVDHSHGALARVDSMIDLVVHKKPALKILEINADATDASSLWFEATSGELSEGSVQARAAYAQYDFASIGAKTMINVQAKYKDKANSSFFLIDPNNEGESLGLPKDASYDIFLLKTSASTSSGVIKTLVKNLKPFLLHGASTLLIRRDHGVVKIAGEEDSSHDSGTPSEASGSHSPTDTPASSIGSESEGESNGKLLALKPSNSFWNYRNMETLSRSAGTDSVIEIAAAHGSLAEGSLGKLLVANLTETSQLSPKVLTTLKASGWDVIEEKAPFPELTKKTDVVLVIDELSRPLLKTATSAQWEALKQLLTSGTPLLWVTKGAVEQGSYRVTDPDNAMVNGLFRVARREDDRAKLTTLDVQSSTSPATSWAIEQVLRSIRASKPEMSNETEYVERDGILYVQRLIPDKPVNDFKQAEIEGAATVVREFHSTGAQLQLYAERVGTLQSLAWNETGVYEEDPVEPDDIEVEVHAVGVNFKDVATSMGIVPENEYMIGFECAGIVNQVGHNVTNYKAGDRVCILVPGSYANRVRVAAKRCHIIPSTMTYEEAATIPSVYLCSLYGLYHLGGLKEGQSVLIHSATGGVGIAAIELALHKKANIYVTVGTEEKRKYLEDTYGIQRSHMFSSRNTKFAGEILRATGGRGIDVILNSLVGELLDESWRIVANGGTMVEIGKRDIVDRNTLAMEPFDRNCSFRAVDMSFTKDIDNDKITSLFNELFVLIEAGHIKPIHPITIFPFDDVPAALSHIRAGRHLGKIVISNQEKEDIPVTVRPAVRKLKLRSDVSYVIVGGLKGACSTLAIHMASHGARHIIVSSRSGIADPASERIIRHCANYGTTVVEAKGDISDPQAVRRLFETAKPRIAGIIQGAMVLRDKPFETMTIDDYHTAVRAKVHGTWNLHNASVAQKHPLDFFSMLSSTSGIVGNKGQANYAAANTFLDAFASYCRSLGHKAHTVDLGVIEDVGYVAEQDTGLEARFDKRQWTPINETMLRKILTYSILQQDNAPLNTASDAEMITGVGFPLTKDGSDLHLEPRFAYLFSSHGAGSVLDTGGDGDATDAAVKAVRVLHKSKADKAALVNAAVEAVGSQFVKILRLEAEVEPGRPLMAYGLDSLSAVELRNWIRQKLGVELTTLDITNASSLISLAEKLVEKLPEPE